MRTKGIDPGGRTGQSDRILSQAIVLENLRARFNCALKIESVGLGALAR